MEMNEKKVLNKLPPFDDPTCFVMKKSSSSSCDVDMTCVDSYPRLEREKERNGTCQEQSDRTVGLILQGHRRTERAGSFCRWETMPAANGFAAICLQAA